MNEQREPTTEAGRRYLDSWDAQREVYTADADIIAIEQEARAPFLAVVDAARELDALIDFRMVKAHIAGPMFEPTPEYEKASDRLRVALAALSKSEEQERD